jgi:hypothetical protein
MTLRDRILAATFALAVLPGQGAAAGVALCPRGGAQVEGVCVQASTSHNGGCQCCASKPLRSSERNRLGEGCGCSHAPQTPADLVRATTPTDPETEAVEVPATETVSIDVWAASCWRATARAAPTTGAPALFLLDCAFLT